MDYHDLAKTDPVRAGEYARHEAMADGYEKILWANIMAFASGGETERLWRLALEYRSLDAAGRAQRREDVTDRWEQMAMGVVDWPAEYFNRSSALKEEYPPDVEQALVLSVQNEDQKFYSARGRADVDEKKNH